MYTGPSTSGVSFFKFIEYTVISKGERRAVLARLSHCFGECTKIGRPLCLRGCDSALVL